MMPESVCFDEFFIIKKSGTSVPLLYIKLKLVGEANASSRLLGYLEIMRIPNPARKKINISPIKTFTLLGAFLNSFQTKTPQNAETIVAPCPKPHESETPATVEERKLKLVPKHQIEPPKTPTR